MNENKEMLKKMLEADLDRLAGEREKAEDQIARAKLVLERVDREEKKSRAQLAALSEQD